jgi:hypothetical protein
LVDGKLLIYGGLDGHECFGDFHALDLGKLGCLFLRFNCVRQVFLTFTKKKKPSETKAWRQLVIHPQIRRFSHSATLLGSDLLIFGGHDGTRYTNDMIALNIVTLRFEERKFYGPPPTSRGYHSATLADSRILVYGGYDGKTVFQDVHVLDLAACSYLALISHVKLGMQVGK